LRRRGEKEDKWEKWRQEIEKEREREREREKEKESGEKAKA